MRISIVLSVCLFLPVVLNAQKKMDIEIIHSNLVNQSTSIRRVNSKGLYALYKNHFTDQIVNSCLYDQSCSTFSHGAFKHYGLFKGALLTADRLSRCNRITYAETHLAFKNSEGKMIDHWEDYEKKE